MKKLDDNVKNSLKQLPGAIFLSLFLIAIGAFFLFMYKYGDASNQSNYMVGIIVGFGLGIFVLISCIASFFGLFARGKKIKKLGQVGTPINAKIISENISTLQTQLVCSAEINGVNYEFISEPVERYTYYACQELGIEELPVYVNMQDPKEYAVDISEVEDRIVDLT